MQLLLTFVYTICRCNPHQQLGPKQLKYGRMLRMLIFCPFLLGVAINAVRRARQNPAF